VRPQVRGRGAAAGVAERETAGAALGHGELEQGIRGIKGDREVLKPNVWPGTGYVDARGDHDIGCRRLIR
jgi:hypothetical protein